jgi:hypothetical protein
MSHGDLMTAVMTSLLGRPPQVGGEVALWLAIDAPPGG